MRQTTKAVALLIASVNAAITKATVTAADGVQGAATVFSVKVTEPTLVSQLSNRTARYWNFKKDTDNQYSWTAPATYQTGKVDPSAAYNTAVSIAGVGCMQCLGSGKGVWCSRTFNYWIAAGKDYQYLSLGNADGLEGHIPGTDAASWKGDWDNGSCCNSAEAFVTLAGSIGTEGTIPKGTVLNAKGTSAGQSNNTAGVPMVARACVATANAKVDGSPNTEFGASSWDVTTVKYTSWWCSNGMYKKVQSGSTGKTNNIQLFSFNDNPRLELAMVACPNKATLCGTSGYALLANNTPVDFKIASTVELLTTDKCTWVVSSYKYAPTFVVAANTSLGITSAGMQLHTMEYTSTGKAAVFDASKGSLSSLTESGDSGFLKTTEGIAFGNFVPRFDMDQEQFATLRTWYGLSGALMTQGGAQFGSQYSSWFTPGNSGASNASGDNTAIAAQGAQFYGNVGTIGTSKYASTGTNALTASDGNYGVANSVKFDYRTVRYVPAAVVQSVYATGETLKTAYNQKVSDYNTAKTVWDNYVAILAKNAKMDAFAAAFSPPKAPTVPPLPNFPWAPAPYTGFLKQTTAQAALLNQNQGAVAFVSTAQPASNQFWTSLDAAQSIGGWGSWTAQIMTYRSGWGKSFGTIGFSTDTKSSFVWNNNWMCIDSTQGDTLACANNKLKASGSAGAPADTVEAVTDYNIDTVAGSAQFVSVVSLWSLGDKNTKSNVPAWKTKSDFKLTFTGESWSTTIPKLTAAISYSSAPSAASTLTGIAGAQALAVSSAAVLALAALY